MTYDFSVCLGYLKSEENFSKKGFDAPMYPFENSPKTPGGDRYKIQNCGLQVRWIKMFSKTDVKVICFSLAHHFVSQNFLNAAIHSTYFSSFFTIFSDNQKLLCSHRTPTSPDIILPNLKLQPLFVEKKKRK